MTNETFYWFDYETWGISPQWDRPSQFAGVRTDTELNIIGKPDMLYCQLPPDYLPDPRACLVTGLSPEFVNSNGVAEPDFIGHVVKLIGSPGTCSVGYNSIRFDDEVSRHTLFRNFHDAYKQEWQDGNSRWDLLDVVRLTRALRPDGIHWPVDEDGTPNNKLENLTTANGLAHEQAHDALSDVHATIAVAKLIKQAQPRLYDFALTLRKKQTVVNLLNWREKKPVVHVSGMVPMAHSHTSVIVPIMRHPTNTNGIIVLDLRTDPEALVGLSADDIRTRVFSMDLPPEQRIHIRTLQTNRCPMVAPLSTLTGEDALRIGLDRSVSIERAKRIGCINTEAEINIAAAMTHQPSKLSIQADKAIARCPEASLYTGGFLSKPDRTRAAQIAQLKPDQLTGFSETDGFFDDKRLQKLLFNYRARHAANTLSGVEREIWQDDCIDRLNDDPNSVPWRTFDGFDSAMENTAWPSGSENLQQALVNWRDHVEGYLMG